MRSLQSFGAWLARRRALALLALVVPCFAVVRVARNGGVWEAEGLPLGWDFSVFLTAARILTSSDAARLYDLTFQREAAHALFPGAYTPFPYLGTPFFALAVWPFTLVAYPLALGLWTALGLAAAWRALGWLGVRGERLFVALVLASFPFVYTVLSGQPTLFTFALLAFVYACVRAERLGRAGIATGLLMYKPQSLLGVLLYFAFVTARTRSRAVLRYWGGFFLVLSLVVGAGYVASPDASRAYLGFARRVLPNLVEVAHFDAANVHTWRAFWALVFGKTTSIGEALAAACGLAGILGCVRFWRRDRGCEAREAGLAVDYAAAITLGVWCAPHGSIYDWAVLAVPASILWATFPERRHAWRAILVTLAAVTLISAPLAAAAEAHLPFSLQPDLPILGSLAWLSTQVIREDRAEPGGERPS